MGGGGFVDLTIPRDQKGLKGKVVDPEYAQFLLGVQDVEERRARELGRERWKMSDDTFSKHLENIWRGIPDDKKASFAYVDSLCFWLYQTKGSEALKMAKKKDIFSKKYVFVPIVGWDHWRLLVFCHFGEATNSNTRTRCILLLDSISMGASVIEPEVRKFVFAIFEAEGRPESKDEIYRIPLFVPKVPQQTNGVDCGRFVLYFIKLFVADAPENFSISNFPSPYFLQPKWFGLEIFTDFCDELEEEIPTYQPEVLSLRRRSQRVRNKRTSLQKISSQNIKLEEDWLNDLSFVCSVESEEYPTNLQRVSGSTSSLRSSTSRNVLPELVEEIPTYQPEVFSSRRRSQRVRNRRTSEKNSSQNIKRKEDWLHDLSYVCSVESEDYPTNMQRAFGSMFSSRSSTLRNVLPESSSESVEVILVND